MQKNNKFTIVIIICAVVAFLAVNGAAYFIGRSHSGDSSRTEQYRTRERELLERIGEYQQREEDRTRREALRIAAERERIERTEAAIRAVRGLDRRSGNLLQELEQEVGILEDYFWRSRDIIDDYIDNMGAE